MSQQIELNKRFKAVQHTPLRKCVQDTVEKHFTTMTGREIKDLYEIVVGEMEKVLIEKVLDFTDGNESRTARILGISRGTLRQRRKKFGHYEQDEK